MFTRGHTCKKLRPRLFEGKNRVGKQPCFGLRLSKAGGGRRRHTRIPRPICGSFRRSMLIMSVCNRLNAVWRGVFGSSRRGAQPEEQRSAATTRRLHQKFRLELCASTNADPMARVTSAQNATSSVFFDTTHLPEAGHLFKRGLADAAWPLSAASAQ